MNQKERTILRAAIDDLERNPCDWEDAMSKLYKLAGFVYVDHRKTVGRTIVERSDLQHEEDITEEGDDYLGLPVSYWDSGNEDDE